MWFFTIIPDFIRAHYAGVLSAFAVFFLSLHLWKKIDGFALSMLMLIVLLGIASFVILWVRPESIDFAILAAVLLLYGVALFILASEGLERKLASILTRWRGEKWAKEIDYLYLSIGALGAVMSLNRIPVVTSGLRGIDAIGPILVMTAIVLRAVKTRVEIGEWNKAKK